MKKGINRALALMLTLCLALSALTASALAAGGSLDNFRLSVPYTQGQFGDVDPAKWYGDNGTAAVRLVCELGLMSGKGGGRFEPEASLTLAEAITMAVRTNLTYLGYEDNTLPAGTPWYQPYVDYAIQNYMISDEAIDYTRTATRAEMAYIFAMSVPESELAPLRTVASLPDVEYNSYYGYEIFLLYEAGVLAGNDAYGSFTPDAPIQRAAAAAIVSRIALPAQRLGSPIQNKPEEQKPAVTGQSWSECYTYGMEINESNADQVARAALPVLANDFTFKTKENLDSFLNKINQRYCTYAGSFNWSYWSDGGYNWATLHIDYSLFAEYMAWSLNPGGITPSAELTKYSAMADKLLDSIVSQGMSDYEKSKAVHDYMVANYCYDNSFQEQSYSFTGLLDYGTGVCQAYAELYCVLMTRCGIRADTVVGYAGESHSWNIINLDGDWYHVDCTWDDPVPDSPGRVIWDYFCITDSEMSADHSWDSGVWPVCSGTKY